MKPIARSDLAILLENEGYLAAGEKIRGDQDPVRVLSELRPFISRYDDDESRNAVATFQQVCGGDLEVA